MNDFNTHPPKTGHTAIDNHHEELFHLVSMLDFAITTKRENIEKIIIFLEHYVIEHFQEEEDLMHNANFKGYNVHKEDHEVFKARVFSLRHGFDSGLSESKLFFAIRMFIDKLVYHIKTIDIRIQDLHNEVKK